MGGKKSSYQVGDANDIPIELSKSFILNSVERSRLVLLDAYKKTTPDIGSNESHCIWRHQFERLIVRGSLMSRAEK
jgi:hypothetical protein